MKNITKSALVALCGAAVLVSCEDDRDSNPVLIDNGNVTFVLNTPEFEGNTILLSETASLPLSWSQPVLTDNNAPLGMAGNYGLIYTVQLSNSGSFTKSFAEALAEVTNEEGDFTGVPTGYDYTSLTSIQSSCKASILCEEVNKALNELNLWAQDEVPGSTTTQLRVVAQLAKTDGTFKNLATSNTVNITAAPTWIDVMVKPAKVAYLWMPGNGNGWSHDNCPVLISTDGEIYTGYAYMDGDFKFTFQAAWADELNNGSFTEAKGGIDLGDGAGGNIGFTNDPGMYFLTVNPGAGIVEAQPVKWGIVGGFNSWSVDDGKIVDMVYNTGSHALEAVVNFDTDTEWKFARDNAWTVNFGGAFDALEQDGPNFSTAAGTYTISLKIERENDGYSASIK